MAKMIITQPTGEQLHPPLSSLISVIFLSVLSNGLVEFTPNEPQPQSLRQKGHEHIACVPANQCCLSPVPWSFLGIAAESYVKRITLSMVQRRQLHEWEIRRGLTLTKQFRLE